MSIRMASVSGAYMYCIWKLNMNEYKNGIRVWSISVLYIKVESEWVSEWHPCLERIWTVSESCLWMSIRMASVSGAYLNCIKSWIWMSIRMASISGAYLNCIKSWIWMSIRMASVSGAYLNCIWKLWTLLMITVNLILKRVKC